jgi:hypothetical protein
VPNTALPMMSYVMWNNAARFDSRLAGMDAITVVMLVPMLVPNMIKADVSKGMGTPLKCSVTKIPVVAEELWMMAVKAKPASNDKNGFPKAVRKALKAGCWASSLNGPPMTETPKNKTPKPSTM